jgi:DnaK suppressor protein
MVAKAKSAKPAKKAAAKTVRPAKAAASKKVAAKIAPPKPVKKPVAARPAGKTAAAKRAPAGAPLKAAPATKRAPAARPATTAKAAPATKARPAAPRQADLAPALSPRTAPAPRPAPVASAKDVAAATEYLLSRSAHRSEEPTVVNGRQLPTEEQLLKMPESAYMNDDQLAFFKYRLQRMEQELVANAGETTEHLRETVIVPDPADRATIEEEHALELRTRDRERKLLKKVQAALQRIDAGEYGYCEETGDPIGIPRLIARPTATLSLEAQQRRELKQKLFGD